VWLTALLSEYTLNENGTQSGANPHRRPMSPRSPALNERLRADSRSRIVAHALRLFAEHGYDRTTIKMIADSAGISQGLIYAHFASKEELLVAIFEQSMRDIEASFAAAGDAADPHERFERYVRGCFEVLRRNLDFWRLSYGVRMQAAVLAHLGDRVPRWTAEIRRTLERFLRAMGVPNPRVEAEILFALIDGVSQHYALDPDAYPLDKVVDRIVGMYLPRRRR
jgi:AcrR family transcriptional regulator